MHYIGNFKALFKPSWVLAVAKITLLLAKKNLRQLEGSDMKNQSKYVLNGLKMAFDWNFETPSPFMCKLSGAGVGAGDGAGDPARRFLMSTHVLPGLGKALIHMAL